MQNCAEEYRNFALEQYEEAKKLCAYPLLYIEQRLDFSRWVEHGFGTGDCVIVADDILQIIDYKHSLGVLVSAENNSQMMCYALGALELFDDLYDIGIIKMTIFQPRRENISSWTITKEELLNWANEVLKPTADLAYEGNGEFAADKHCMFCKAKTKCRQGAEHNLELAKYDFEMPATLDDLEISAILPTIDQLVSQGNDIKNYAVEMAQRGTHFESFKVMECRSNRKYTDEAEVAAAVKEAGFYPYEQKLLNITAMTSLLGKKKFEEVSGTLVFNIQGKPALFQKTTRDSQ